MTDLNPGKKSETKKNNSTRISLFVALILSIFVIHLPLTYLFVSHILEKQKTEQAQTKIDKDKVVMVDLNQKSQLPNRIADISKPKTQTRPQKATAQSLYDSSVKQEMVNRKFSKVNEPLGGQTASKQKQQQQPAQSQVQKPSMRDQLRMLQSKQSQEKTEKHNELFNKPAAAPQFQTNLGSAQGGNTGEFFPDYKVGNRTYLNTLANPNIGFFVELRRRFRFAFNPSPVLRPHVNQISQGRISVVWGVSVNAQGQIVGLTLLRGSGIRAYDLEGRRTISVSAPFSHPPANMLSKTDNLLHMAWTFVVYM